MHLSGASACFVSPTKVITTRVRAGGFHVYQSHVSLQDLPPVFGILTRMDLSCMDVYCSAVLQLNLYYF